MPKLGDAKVYGFRYDQLNRLKAMNAYEWLNNSTNSFSAITLDDYMERLTYDANGNILSYIRNGFGSGIAMNDYSYTYEAGSNRLSELYNSASGGHSYTYEYDEIGNVTLDSKQGVNAAEWNVYGKLKSVTKSGTDIEYSYDAGGQRISKKVNSTEEWYVKDLAGNTMAIYTKDAAVNSGHLSTKEFNKYGTDPLGTEKLIIDVQTPSSPTEIITFKRGITDYLLNDHRGNNMAMVTDKKLQHSTDGTTVDYYLADVRTASYYSAYGAISKSFNDGQIDVAHNGQKRSTEISASAQTALFWEYDGDVGRRWNVDPVLKENESPYVVFGNNPIWNIDPNGADSLKYLNNDQALDAMTIASKTLKRTLEKKQKIATQTTSNTASTLTSDVKGALVEAADAYAQANNLSLGADAEFNNLVLEYAEALRHGYQAGGVGVLNEIAKYLDLSSTSKTSSTLVLKNINRRINVAEMDYIQKYDATRAIFVQLVTLSLSYGTLNIGPGLKGPNPRLPFVAKNSSVTVEYNGGMSYIYRGGKNFDLKQGEFKVSTNPSAKYPVRGLSLTADETKAAAFGGATRIHKIPDGLKIIHTPSSNDPAHFDIIPVNPKISQAEYQNLLNQINK
jgi:hypothetical protein